MRLGMVLVVVAGCGGGGVMMDPDAAAPAPDADWAGSTSGGRDPSFGVDGVAEAVSGLLDDVVVMDDGRIVACGSNVEGNAALVVRWTEDGLLDDTFGDGGVVTLALPDATFVQAHAVAVDATGRVLIAGEIDIERSFVARLTEAGDLDTSFRVVGYVTSSDLLQASDVAVLDDGGIVVAANHPMPASMYEAAIVHYTAAGELVSDLRVPVTGYLAAAAIEPDGAVWLGTTTLSAAEVGARFVAADGTAAPVMPGIEVTSGWIDTSAMIVMPDGRPLAAGRGTSLFAMRYGTTGAADVTFGAGGLAGPICCESGGAEARGIGLQPDGRVVLIGWTNHQVGDVFHTVPILARLMPDGALDTTYGTGGVLLDPFCAPDEACGVHIGAGLVDDHGRALAAGYRSEGGGVPVTVLARYLP